MVATPFVAVITLQTDGGRVYTQRATVSDVIGAFYIFQDGSSDLTLPIDEGAVYIKDIALSAAGVDTTYALIFANQRETGEQIQNSLNLASNLSRQYIGAPIGFKGGARIKIKQA